MSRNKRSHDWLEKRRLRAIDLSLRGWAQAEIVEALGVTKGAVSQWLKQLTLVRALELDGLKSIGVTR